LTAVAVDAPALTVRRYTSADARAWDDFVARSRTSHFMFARGYMDYHADRFEDHSLMILDRERPVALLPASRRDECTVVSHGGLTFGGLVHDSRMTTAGMLRALDALVGDLRSSGVDELLYKPVPYIYSDIPSDEDLYALFRRDARLVRRDVSAAIRLDARVPYSKGRKHSVKQARRAGLEVARGDDFHEFMELEARVLAERHDATPTHSGAELELLARRFPDNVKLYTARGAGTLLAGVLMYETPAVAHTQYIASSYEGRSLGAADAIIDELIGEHAQRGTRWFDFGISTEAGGSYLNEGLARNKESYGARAVVYDQWSVPLR
jgi:hypothetical protein